MKYDWKEKVVLITGASSGIGRALALELGKRGARLGLTARRAEELSKVAEEVSRAGGEALALPADVRAPKILTASRRVCARSSGALTC
jgi:NADP-dependent 3-hydroxy acid dehydrogenase YdfG